MLGEGEWVGKRGESEGGWRKEAGGGNDGGFLARFGDGDNIAVVLFSQKTRKTGHGQRVVWENLSSSVDFGHWRLHGIMQWKCESPKQQDGMDALDVQLF